MFENRVENIWLSIWFIFAHSLYDQAKKKKIYLCIMSIFWIVKQLQLQQQYLKIDRFVKKVRLIGNSWATEYSWKITP